MVLFLVGVITGAAGVLGLVVLVAGLGVQGLSDEEPY